MPKTTQRPRGCLLRWPLKRPHRRNKGNLSVSAWGSGQHGILHHPTTSLCLFWAMSQTHSSGPHNFRNWQHGVWGKGWAKQKPPERDGKRQICNNHSRRATTTNEETEAQRRQRSHLRPYSEGIVEGNLQGFPTKKKKPHKNKPLWSLLDLIFCYIKAKSAPKGRWVSGF